MAYLTYHSLYIDWGASLVSPATELCRGPEIVPDKKQKAGILFTGCLRLSNDMYLKTIAGSPCQVNLNFTAKDMFWEYLFIPRKEDQGDKTLVLEESPAEAEIFKPGKNDSSLHERPHLEKYITSIC